MMQPIGRPPLRSPGSEVDVAVVGAGAAGIAAARRCLSEGLSVAVLEARDRVGGRAVTASFGGHPIDLGAHWLHAGAVNPLVRLGRERGEPLRRSPAGGHHILRDGRFGSRADRHANGRAFELADRAFGAAARADADTTLAATLPWLGRWRLPIATTFALISGRPLTEVSAKDFPSEEFGDNHFVRGGYGAFLARLAAGLPVALGCPVRNLDWSGADVVLDTDGGRLRARAAIVTAPVAVLAAGGLRFTPDLSDAHAAALGGFLPGTYEHVVLNWPGAPFRDADRFAKLVSSRRAHSLMTRLDGAPFHYLELDHDTVESRAGRDRAGLAHLAREVLAHHFGARRLAGLRILAVTDWVGDPWSRSAWAVAPPGKAAARDVLSRPVGDRVWFAGEANVRAMWGTVGGAWESGDGAAGAIARRLQPRG